MNMNDDPQELMRLAQSGDRAAFERVYDVYFVPVFRYVYTRIKDREKAEDLTQDVFLKIFRRIDLYEDRNKEPLTLFFTVARNTLIDHYKKKKDVLVDNEMNTFGNIPDANSKKDVNRYLDLDRESVYSMTSGLSETYREVIRLKYVADLSYREIAMKIKKNEINVRKIHSRAVKQLYKILQDKEIL